MPTLSFREALRKTIEIEMERDPGMYLLGENIATWGGASGVTHGLVEKFGRERVVETPVAENAIVGMALGSAIAGVRTLAEVYSADFLFCAGSEVINDIAKWRFQHGWNRALNLVLRMPTLSSGIWAGPEHTQAIEGYLQGVNGLGVVFPGTVKDAVGSLRASLRCGDPVVFLEHRRLYDQEEFVSDADLTGYVSDLSRAQIVSEGSDLTVVCWGWMRQVVTGMQQELQERSGLSLAVIDPLVVRPLDFATIADSVCATGRLLVVEESPRTGSVAGEILTRVRELVDRPIAAQRLTMVDMHNPFNREVEETLIPDTQRIDSAIRQCMSADKQ